MNKILRIVLIVVAIFISLRFVSCALGADPKLQTVPYIEAEGENPSDGAIFGDGKGRGDRGLKPIDPPRFDLPKPNVFIGIRIVKWGFSIAGAMLGLFVAIVVVVLAVKFLRRTAVPAITGIPAAPVESLLVLQLLDKARRQILDRRRELTKEANEIDRRLGKPKAAAKRSTTKKKA